MRPIPTKMRVTLTAMPRMKMCEVSWNPELGPCTPGKIDWHHVWIYAGSQINELWAILGACRGHHERVKHDKAVREEFERRSLEIATDEELARYPNKPWVQIMRYLGVVILTS